MKRNGLRITLGVVGALLAVVGIAWIGGAFDSDDDTVTGADPSTSELDQFGDTLPADTFPPAPAPSAAPPTSNPAQFGAPPPAAPSPPDPVPHELPAPPADPSECPAADGS